MFIADLLSHHSCNGSPLNIRNSDSRFSTTSSHRGQLLWPCILFQPPIGKPPPASCYAMIRDFLRQIWSSLRLTSSHQHSLPSLSRNIYPSIFRCPQF